MKREASSKGCYPTIILSSKHEWVSGGAGVMSAHRWLEVWGGEKGFVPDHPGRHIMRELFDLLPNVSQEGVA